MTKPYIRSVPMPRPFIWLREGWDDLMRHRGASIAYGVPVSLLGAMIVDRHVEARKAMQMSLRVTLRDLPAMLVWAALIVGRVYLGSVTGLLGMVFIFPLPGHATWRAYRELVEH
jgi:uncharacterized membrane protein